MGAGGAKGAKPIDESLLAKEFNLTPTQIQSLIVAFKMGADSKPEIDKDRFIKVVKLVRDAQPELAPFKDEIAGLVFTLCDTDHSGKVDPLEVVAALAVFSSGNDQEKAKLVFKTIDKNNDGTLTKDEVKKHAAKVLAFSASLVKGDVKTASKEAGLGLVGSLAASAISTSLGALEKQFAEDVTREVFSADKNADGKITIDEWLGAVATNNTVKALIDPNLSANAWRVVFCMDDGVGSDNSNVILEQVQRSPKGFAYIFDLEMQDGKYKPLGPGVPRPPPKADYDLVLVTGATTAPVKIATSASLGDLKAQASAISGIPVAHMVLMKGDASLGRYDEAKLDTRELVDGDRITVYDFTAAAGELKVKTLTGKVFGVNFAAADKVLALKERVQDSQGIPPDQQRLIVQGASMENEKSCADYQLVPGVTLHLVLRLRGAP